MGYKASRELTLQLMIIVVIDKTASQELMDIQFTSQ